ncbi:MAG TPA: gamma-glutamyl-gamma-aminobutyrate hydrolase family protein [Thermodesulfovibrionales bacterium]|nr:gamma-glutamyl-gamma-aminobutyrate hydrolase family protein [Thermodesulfovibrionales bacterium]
MGDEPLKERPLIGITIGRDGESFAVRREYAEAVQMAGGLPVLLPYGLDPSSVAKIIDGLIIPGGDDIDPAYFSESPHPTLKLAPRERSDFEIALLGAIMKVRKPVFGICYGMQLMNVALSGTLYQDIGSEFGMTIDHRKGCHRIKGNDLPMKGEFVVNSSHHQAVRKLGEGLEVSALSDDDLVEAFFLTGYPFFCGVQWHPERSDDALSTMLLRVFVEHAHACK